MELFPVRCYTCGRVLAGLQREYERLVQSGVPIHEAMDRLGIIRVCCRTRAMNPGKYVFPGEDDYTLSATAVRKPTAQPSGIETQNVLTAIKSGSQSTVQLPSIERIPPASNIPTPTRTLTPLTPLNITPSKSQVQPLPPTQSLRPLQPLSGLEQPLQNLQLSSNINIAPLNLEGVQLKPLADIKIPRSYYI